MISQRTLHRASRGAKDRIGHSKAHIVGLFEKVMIVVIPFLKLKLINKSCNSVAIV